MKCDQCKIDTFCVPFRSYNNDGLKSYMKEIWLCIECVEKGGWEVDSEWRAKGKL